MASGPSRQHGGALASEFAGRGAELARVGALLDGARLVTLTGAGGVGKTSLALHAAAEAAHRYADGTRLVELAPLRDPATLAYTVACHLDLPGGDEPPGMAAVLDHLRDRELLLILDTCEHLVDACATFASVVLREAPGVTILATSRQPLDAAGECTFLLYPLTVPAAGGQAAVADAVELFAPRHRTLRAAIAWSYELCTRPEQLLWARLSVFAGSFDIATAEEVCAGGELSREDIVELMVALVDKSVLVRDADADVDVAAPARPGGHGTYRMLDPLRGFGAEQLADTGGDAVAGGRGGAGAGAVTRNRFVAHYLALAQRFGRDPMRDQLGQYHALRREHANLRAAFDYALELPGNDSAAVSIATSLVLYWRLSGRLREGELWLNRVLARCGQPSAVRARVLSARAYVTMLLGDFDAARADAETAIELAAAFGDLAACGRAYLALHRGLTWTGRPAEAAEQADAALACLGSAADPFGLASLDLQHAMLLLNSGETDRVIERCVAGMARLPADERWATGYLLGLKCAAHLLRGEFGQGGVAGRLGLTLEYQLGDVGGIACLLGINAFLAAGQHRYERAALLLGGSAPLWERVGRWYTDAPALVALHRMAERLARGGLGDDRYVDSCARGRATPLDRVIELALADADSLPAAAVGLKVVPPLELTIACTPNPIAYQDKPRHDYVRIACPSPRYTGSPGGSRSR